LCAVVGHRGCEQLEADLGSAKGRPEQASDLVAPRRQPRRRRVPTAGQRVRRLHHAKRRHQQHRSRGVAAPAAPRGGRPRGITGQDVVSVANLHTGTVAGPFFFADADLDSGNIIMSAPLSAVGLTPGTKFDFSVYAFDNYFSGFLTDAVENMTYTLSTPRFV